MGDIDNKAKAIMAIGAVGLIAVVGYFVRSSTVDVKQFDPKIKEWVKAPSDATSESPYVRGKVFPINRFPSGDYTPICQELFDELPRSLKPRNPDEVGTVLWCEWTEEVRTGGPGPGFQTVVVTDHIPICKVTVIDVRSKKKLAVKTFRAREPSKESTSWIKPLKDMVDYLESLPKRDL